MHFSISLDAFLAHSKNLDEILLTVCALSYDHFHGKCSFPRIRAFRECFQLQLHEGHFPVMMVKLGMMPSQWEHACIATDRTIDSSGLVSCNEFGESNSCDSVSVYSLWVLKIQIRVSV